MKLKKAKKHVKEVKITMKFDSIEAAKKVYDWIHEALDEDATMDPGTYVRIERWEKKPKVVVTASGRDIIDEIF